MDRIMRDLGETNKQISEKMKDILTTDGFCIGVCKKKEREAEIEQRIKNIEEKLEEDEIIVKGLKAIEKKTGDDINKLKEKNRTIRFEIDKLTEMITRNKSHQNASKAKRRVRITKNAGQLETNDDNRSIVTSAECQSDMVGGKSNQTYVRLGNMGDKDKITSLDNEVKNKTSSKSLELKSAQIKRKSNAENQQKDNERACDILKTTELSERNIISASGGNKQEEFGDKSSLQLIPVSTEVAKRSPPTSNGNCLQRRNKLDIEHYEQERWVNNHKCVHQTQKKHCFDFFAWDIKANAEKRTAISEGTFQIESAQSLLLIDTSESMSENEAWREVCTFVHNYLDGLEEMAFEHGIKQERVAIVTFGRRTEVVQHLTFDIQEVRHAFDSIELGGPTPMFGGLILIDGALNRESFDVNGLAVYPKIILITDGNPTETDLVAGPDHIDPNNEQGAKSRILGVAENMSTLDVDLFCVPVGKKDNDFLPLFVEMSDGIMLSHKDGRNLARRLFLTMEASKEPNAGLLLLPFLRGMYWDPEHNMMCRRMESATDRAEKEKIVSRIKRKENQRADLIIQEIYRDTNDPKLPRVGSRVRRGPDKDPENTLDKNGPGTIVGHSSDENCVNVNWDNSGRVEKCMYGKNGLYEVVLVEEPRILAEEVTMATGCVVVPGKDWQTDEYFQGHGTKGITVAYNAENGAVKVKWENGNNLTHTFSPLREEVVLERDHQRSSTSRAIEPAQSRRGQRNKNLK